jgi:hypothetical protein
MGGNDQSRLKKMENEIKELRAKITDIQLNIVNLNEADDAKGRKRFFTKINIEAIDLEKQLDNFFEEYRREIATRDVFTGLYQLMLKAKNLGETSSLKELEELNKKFSKIDSLLLNYLRKHF